MPSLIFFKCFYITICPSQMDHFYQNFCEKLLCINLFKLLSLSWLFIVITFQLFVSFGLFQILFITLWRILNWTKIFEWSVGHMQRWTRYTCWQIIKLTSCFGNPLGQHIGYLFGNCCWRLDIKKVNKLMACHLSWEGDVTLES